MDAPDLLRLPGGLPVPADDGAASHLPGRAMPALGLPATDGRRVALAGPEQGMHGATACAFGVGTDDTALFVTTTGGIVMPVDDVPREAKLVRLDVARRGRPLTATGGGSPPGGS